ncbi:MAG: ketopantoate reductase family protein [Candidatus Scalindua sp.]
MNILICGSGAAGLYVASIIKPEFKLYYTGRGIYFDSLDKEHVRLIHDYKFYKRKTHAFDHKLQYDIVFLAVKYYDLRESLNTLIEKRIISNSTMLITCQSIHGTSSFVNSVCLSRKLTPIIHNCLIYNGISVVEPSVAYLYGKYVPNSFYLNSRGISVKKVLIEEKFNFFKSEADINKEYIKKQFYNIIYNVSSALFHENLLGLLKKHDKYLFNLFEDMASISESLGHKITDEFRDKFFNIKDSLLFYYPSIFVDLIIRKKGISECDAIMNSVLGLAKEANITCKRIVSLKEEFENKFELNKV